MRVFNLFRPRSSWTRLVQAARSGRLVRRLLRSLSWVRRGAALQRELGTEVSHTRSRWTSCRPGLPVRFGNTFSCRGEPSSLYRRVMYSPEYNSLIVVLVGFRSGGGL